MWYCLGIQAPGAPNASEKMDCQVWNQLQCKSSPSRVPRTMQGEEGKVLPSCKRQKSERGIKQPPERGDCHSAGVWWLSGSSPPLQMWRKHALLLLFPLLCHPPHPLPLLSTFLSFIFLLCFSFCSALLLSLTGCLCSLCGHFLLSPFFTFSSPPCLFLLALCPPTSLFPPFSSSLYPLSRDEWVEWSIVPWRLLSHPFFRRARPCVRFVCTRMCVFFLSPNARKMDVLFHLGLNKWSDLLVHRCCPTNI